MKRTFLTGFIFVMMFSMVFLTPQLSFAKSSLQEGLWDFDYVGIIVSDNELRVGQEMEIQIPVFNTGQESGSVLVSITLQDSLKNNFYGETKIFDIPPNSKDYPSAKFYFIPEVSGEHSVNVVIHTPDAAHIFDASPSGLFLNALEMGQTADIPRVAIVKLDSQPISAVENIPQEIAAQAVLSPVGSEPTVNYDQSRIVQLENELASVKNELFNVKKDMNIKSVDDTLMLFLVLGVIITIGTYLIYKNRKSVKAVLSLLVNHYKQPIPAK